MKCRDITERVSGRVAKFSKLKVKNKIPSLTSTKSYLGTPDIISVSPIIFNNLRENAIKLAAYAGDTNLWFVSDSILKDI